MLRIAVVFLVLALIAGLFGFNLVADLSWDSARILFVVFLSVAVVFFIGDSVRPGAVEPLEPA